MDKRRGIGDLVAEKKKRSSRLGEREIEPALSCAIQK
jgi:hypothetical protein